MSVEKIACNFSNYPIRFCGFEDISKLAPEEAKLKFIPVGSVEYTRAYCDHVGMRLPINFSYPEQFRHLLHRMVKRGLYKEASFSDFVKPQETKTFTGNLNISPGSYSIDIGWRPDLNCYSLVEINDGWSLGLYNPTDQQSNPPTRQQYADMLVARWRQILFCNIG